MSVSMLRTAGNLLVCLHYGIGDIIMQLPVLKALRELVPAARITALGAQPAVELLQDDGQLDALQSIQDWGLSHWGDDGTHQIRQQLGTWLARNDFDLILDPSHAVIAVRNAVWDYGAQILDTDANMCLSSQNRNGMQAISSAVHSGWGFAIPEEMIPRLLLKTNRQQFAANYLRKKLIRNMPRLALSPVASSALKRWPVESPSDCILAGRCLIDRYSCIAGVSPEQVYETACDLLNPVHG